MASVTLTATDTASLRPFPGAGLERVHDPLAEPATLGLIADPLSLRRLEAVLSGAFEIVSRAQGVEALTLQAAEPMDVVVLAGGCEVCSPGGAVEALGCLSPAPAIVVVAKSDDRSLVRKALRAGAHGFVCERGLGVSLVTTIDAVLAGQLSVPHTICNPVPWRTLSLRERQVLRLVSRGMTNGEIAYGLCLSESTVKTHLSSSFRKLGVSSRAEAAALVLDPQHGLPAVTTAGAASPAP